MNIFILALFMFENVYISQVILKVVQIHFQATHTDIREKTMNSKNSNLQFFTQVIKVQLLAYQSIG